ncbi:MAG: TetR/AcrR family transcriptional regulator [Spirochaetaceae bacterium]|nr:MAG: TetR/AcrR family transcriptional regulator [Spirochaetaceae bacterium]
MVQFVMAQGSRIPRQDRSTRTRERIVQAAHTCFVASGYDATQTKDIAREAEVSIGTYYEYFKDKSAAFQVVLDDFYAAFDELQLERFLADDTGEEGFLSLFGALRHWALSFGHLFADFATLAVRDSAFEESLRLFESKIESRIETILLESVFSQQPDLTTDAARLIYTLTEALLLRSVIELDEDAASRLLREASICLNAYVRVRTGA